MPIDFSAFHTAILEGSASTLDKLLVEAPEFDRDQFNANGYTMLILAILSARSRGLEHLKVLLKHGANINKSCSRGNPPLQYAIITGELTPVVQFLLDSGADVNQTDRNQTTLLHRALELDYDPTLVRAFIERGANMNQADRFGKTPLYYAIFESTNFACLKDLIAHGAGEYLNVPMMSRSTLLDMAGYSVNSSPAMKLRCHYLQMVDLMLNLFVAPTPISFYLFLPLYYYFNRAIMTALASSVEGDSQGLNESIAQAIVVTLKRSSNPYSDFCRVVHAYSLIKYTPQIVDACKKIFSLEIASEKVSLRNLCLLKASLTSGGSLPFGRPGYNSLPHYEALPAHIRAELARP